jgi:hypothetical protein
LSYGIYVERNISKPAFGKKGLHETSDNGVLAVNWGWNCQEYIVAPLQYQPGPFLLITPVYM